MRKAINKLTPVIVMAIVCSATTTNAATTYDAPSNSEFKSYMGHNAITSKTSAQYAMKDLCVTTANGLRLYNGRYCVAIGTGYNAPVGTYVDIELDTGVVLPCIVADVKADCDTTASNLQDKNNNSVVEFVVDTARIKAATNHSGSVSSIPGFEGDVKTVTVYSNEDMAQIDWKPVVTDFENTKTFLVTDKYSVTVGDKTLYLLEYASATDFNTIEVTEDVYKCTQVNYSVISL